MDTENDAEAEKGTKTNTCKEQGWNVGANSIREVSEASKDDTGDEEDQESVGEFKGKKARVETTKSVKAGIRKQEPSISGSDSASEGEDESGASTSSASPRWMTRSLHLVPAQGQVRGIVEARKVREKKKRKR